MVPFGYNSTHRTRDIPHRHLPKIVKDKILNLKYGSLPSLKQRHQRSPTWQQFHTPSSGKCLQPL